MVVHWSLSDSKSPQVSRTRPRILAVLSSAVFWIVSTCPPNSKSCRPFNNPLVIVPNAPITIGTIVTLMFHSFFNSLARVEVLILLLSLLFTPLEFLLEFERQQVSSSLRDSSQDSGRSKQCCHLDSLYPSANFQVLQAF